MIGVFSIVFLAYMRKKYYLRTSALACPSSTPFIQSQFPRNYCHPMQPMLQILAHNIYKKTAAPYLSMRAFALALSETFVPSDSALLKAIPPKIRSLNAAHVLQKMH